MRARVFLARIATLAVYVHRVCTSETSVLKAGKVKRETARYVFGGIYEITGLRGEIFGVAVEMRVLCMR